MNSLSGKSERTRNTLKERPFNPFFLLYGLFRLGLSLSVMPSLSLARLPILAGECRNGRSTGGTETGLYSTEVVSTSISIFLENSRSHLDASKVFTKVLLLDCVDKMFVSDLLSWPINP